MLTYDCRYVLEHQLLQINKPAHNVCSMWTKGHSMNLESNLSLTCASCLYNQYLCPEKCLRTSFLLFESIFFLFFCFKHWSFESNHGTKALWNQMCLSCCFALDCIISSTWLNVHCVCCILVWLTVMLLCFSWCLRLSTVRSQGVT